MFRHMAILKFKPDAKQAGPQGSGAEEGVVRLAPLRFARWGKSGATSVPASFHVRVMRCCFLVFCPNDTLKELTTAFAGAKPPNGQCGR